MFKLNLKIALRNLWRNKGFTLINLGGLAIGLASCMVLLLYVAYEWGYDKQFKDYDKTYVVYNNQSTATQIFTFAALPGLIENEVRTKMPGVASVARFAYPEKMLLSINDNKFKMLSSFADPDFFKIFDYKILKGNPKQLLKNPDGIVLTETAAKKLFGNEDPLNKVVKLDNKENLRVEAVIEDMPKNSSNQADFILAWTLFEKINPWAKNSGWGSNYCMLFVKLQDNSFFEAANNQLKKMIKANNPESNNEAFLFPLSKFHLYETFENGKNVGGRIDQLKIFFLLAFCILLIACVNFMNLSTAKSEKRAKEVGVRKAIGSTRNNLIGQFMFESILLAFLSMAVAFMLIEIALPYFNSLLGIILKIEYTDVKFWVVFLGLTLLTGVIAGSYPAFYLSSFNPISVLKGFKISGGSSLSIRKFLVVFQFVFAACLIVCTTIIYQQLNFIKNKPIGYSTTNLVQIPVEGNLLNKDKRKLLEDHLIKSGAVISVAGYSSDLTQGGYNTYGINWPGQTENDKSLVNLRFADQNLTKTTGMEIISGRDFSTAYTDSSNVLINETLAKLIGKKDIIGSTVFWGNEPVKVIGVLKNFVMESPYKSPLPMIVGQNDNRISTMILKLSNNTNITSSINTIKEIVQNINPEYPVNLTFVDQNFEAKFRNEQLLGTLSNWFGGFAIFISCLGLLGLALFMAEQRKKEISIRKVLGASTSNILILLNKNFVKLVAIANLIAFPIAYVIIKKWLSAYQYRIEISLLPFAIAILISLIIAILTVSVQSIKVAKANPADALKYE